MAEQLVSTSCVNMVRHTSCTRIMEGNLRTRSCTLSWLNSGRIPASYTGDLAAQGIVERANQDFKKQLFARFISLGKPMNEWVSELKFVQCSKNTVYHSGVGRIPYCVRYGRKPPDLASYTMLPTEMIDSLKTEDDLSIAFEQS